MVDPQYLSTTETANIIRAAIKRAFPGVKFSTRTNKYSGGSSFYINWNNGPAKEAVDLVVMNYARSIFDGTIDLAIARTAWLLPDGSATIARLRGTVSAGGCIEPINAPAPSTDARLVRFNIASIICHRFTTEQGA